MWVKSKNSSDRASAGYQVIVRLISATQRPWDEPCAPRRGYLGDYFAYDNVSIAGGVQYTLGGILGLLPHEVNSTTLGPAKAE